MRSIVLGLSRLIRRSGSISGAYKSFKHASVSKQTFERYVISLSSRHGTMAPWVMRCCQLQQQICN